MKSNKRLYGGAALAVLFAGLSVKGYFYAEEAVSPAAIQANLALNDADYQKKCTENFRISAAKFSQLNLEPTKQAMQECKERYASVDASESKMFRDIGWMGAAAGSYASAMLACMTFILRRRPLGNSAPEPTA